MQPSSQPSSQPDSKPDSTSKPRRARGPQRAERYRLAHRSRHVIAARDAGANEFGSNEADVDEAGVDEAASPPEYSTRAAAAPRAKPRRAPAMKKIRRVRFGLWEWIGLGISLVACALLAGQIVQAQADHHALRVAVREKQVQLDALEKQRLEENKKLAYLQSEKGREQILAARGYLKPGDRILLFPTTSPQDGSGAASTP